MMKTTEIQEKVDDVFALEIALQMATADRDHSLTGKAWSQAVMDRLSVLLERARQEKAAKAKA
jgi:hypothetical protein